MSIITDLRDQADTESKWDDEEPIISEQPPTWVYWNQRGQIVIRQRLVSYEDEEPFLFFSVENVPALIRALREKLAELDIAEDLPAPRIEAKTARPRLTNAERQRRYRNTRRNAERNESNAERNEKRDSQRDSRDEKRDEPALLFSSADGAG
jgi:hypothetical protein